MLGNLDELCGGFPSLYVGVGTTDIVVFMVAFPFLPTFALLSLLPLQYILISLQSNIFIRLLVLQTIQRKQKFIWLGWFINNSILNSSQI